MLEFSSRKEIRPMVRIVGVEDMEVGFNLLVDWFSLAVGLRMISHYLA